MGRTPQVTKGYTRRMLRVDLTSRTCRVEAIPEDIIERYFGAKGMAAYYLTRWLEPGIDPLSPDNILILSTGAFQGTGASSAGRIAVVSRSPLTGIFIDSYAGGDLGHAVKLAGYDMLVFEGGSDTPVWVEVCPDSAEVHSASDLQGKTTWETERVLRRRLEERCEVLSIGPAGERLVRFATPITNYRRAAGRGGTGAVMGSKRLKAVAVHGRVKVEHADGERVASLIREGMDAVARSRSEGDDFLRYGTSMAPPYASRTDRIPTRNYRECVFEGAEELAGERIHARYPMQASRCCTPCVIACEGLVKGQARGTPLSDRPEYETLAMLGANAGISDVRSVMRSNDLCNTLGLDTISTGGVVGFALECVENGLIDEEWRFDDPGSPAAIIEKISAREGAGDILAEGVRRAAEVLGGDAWKFAVHGKGLEVPAWDPRGKLGAGLAYATADVGASHLRDLLYRTKRVPNVSALEIVDDLVRGQNSLTARDSYILCAFAWNYIGEDGALDLFNAITGMGLSKAGLDERCERVWTLIRYFNTREGISRKDDTLSWRPMNDPLPTGPARGCTAFVSEADLQKCLDRYYDLRGWDENGVPTRETLTRLGIDIPF